MSVDMLSAVLHGKNDLRLEHLPVPVAGRGQLFIKVHTVGICGTDMHFWQHGSMGSYIVKAPLVLGHESSGTVVALGEHTKGFKVGDKVAMDPSIPCKNCQYCKTGRYNLCSKQMCFGMPPRNGAFTRYVVHDAEYCFKLPDSVSYEEGALIEPLSCVVHACKRAGMTVGERVLILGAGPIGLLCMMVAQANGATSIVVTDVNDARLSIAKELGAQHTVNVKGLSIDEVRTKIHEALGTAPDVSFECSGATTAIETGITTTRSGGVVALVGLGSDRAELPIIDGAIREVDIRGTFRQANCYPTAIDLVASKRVDLSRLTRAHYKLEQTLEAFQRFRDADVIKVFITCDD